MRSKSTNLAEAVDFSQLISGEPPAREFAFAEADFRALAQLAKEYAGISLSDSKRNLVYGRISRRIRALGLSSFREYRERLEGPEGKVEIQRFINSISTNHTNFFRESHHFDHLSKEVANPYAHAAPGADGGRFRIWSAGCSTGEEPYTIALVLKKEIPNIARRDVRILATDIDTDVLATAARGIYSATSLQTIPEKYRSNVNTKDGKQGDGSIEMSEEIRALITFRPLNLMGSWPFKGFFDAIFCRNVMIYFDAPTKATLIERYTRQLKPGGWLYIGHSESLIGSYANLKLVGRTIYRREA